MAGILTNIGRRAMHRVLTTSTRKTAVSIPKPKSPPTGSIRWDRSRWGLILASSGATLGALIGSDYTVSDIKVNADGTIPIQQNFTKNQVKMDYIGKVVGASIGLLPGLLIWRFGHGKHRRPASVDKSMVPNMIAASGSVIGGYIAYALSILEDVTDSNGNVIAVKNHKHIPWLSEVLPNVVIGSCLGALPGAAFAVASRILSTNAYFWMVAGVGMLVGGKAGLMVASLDIADKFRDRKTGVLSKNIQLNETDLLHMGTGMVAGAVVGLVPASMMTSAGPFMLMATTGIVCYKCISNINNAPDEKPNAE